MLCLLRLDVEALVILLGLVETRPFGGLWWMGALCRCDFGGPPTGTLSRSMAFG